MEFREVGAVGKQEKWFGLINFTLAALVDCKWHLYKYSIHISEEDKHAVWYSMMPEGTNRPDKTATDKPKPAEAPPPPEEAQPKKKLGVKDPPPPPQNCVVDDFCFYSATMCLPTSARIKILDPMSRPKKAVWAELTFLRWLHGAPPRIVFLRPSKNYPQYRFRDFSFWVPPPPPPPPRRRLRYRT